MHYLVSLSLSVTNTGLGIKIRVLCSTLYVLCHMLLDFALVSLHLSICNWWDQMKSRYILKSVTKSLLDIGICVLLYIWYMLSASSLWPWWYDDDFGHHSHWLFVFFWCLMRHFQKHFFHATKHIIQYFIDIHWYS